MYKREASAMQLANAFCFTHIRYSLMITYS